MTQSVPDNSLNWTTQSVPDNSLNWTTQSLPDCLNKTGIGSESKIHVSAQNDDNMILMMSLMTK